MCVCVCVCVCVCAVYGFVKEHTVLMKGYMNKREVKSRERAMRKLRHGNSCEGETHTQQLVQLEGINTHYQNSLSVNKLFTLFQLPYNQATCKMMIFYLPQRSSKERCDIVQERHEQPKTVSNRKSKQGREEGITTCQQGNKKENVCFHH